MHFRKIHTFALLLLVVHITLWFVELFSLYLLIPILPVCNCTHLFWCENSRGESSLLDPCATENHLVSFGYNSSQAVHRCELGFSVPRASEWPFCLCGDWGDAYPTSLLLYSTNWVILRNHDIIQLVSVWYTETTFCACCTSFEEIQLWLVAFYSLICAME